MTNFESMRFEKINSSITTIRKLKIYFFIELLREVFCKPDLPMSICWSVSLIPAAAAQTIVETFAESTANAADTCTEEEEDDGSQDKPDPEVRSTLTINCQRSQELFGDSSILVAVGNIFHTLVISHTLSSPKLLHKSLQFLIYFIEGFIDVIVSISPFTNCCSGRHKHGQTKNLEQNHCSLIHF